ncbi:hypothetical protein [Spirosoma aerophilum]
MKGVLMSLLVFWAVYQGLDSSWIEAVSIALSVYTFAQLMAELGETIALLACIRFIASVEILLVPALTYLIFPASMPIESASYFSYALPAYTAFYVGVSQFSTGKSGRSHAAYLQAAADYLKPHPETATVLLIIGLMGFAVKMLVPTAPTFLGLLPSYCLFIGAFYGYYSASTYRFLMTGVVLLVLLVHTVWTGMFGDLFTWGLLAIIFLAAGRPGRITTQRKAIAITAALVCLLLIQSIKAEYRYNTWGSQRTERSGDMNLMATLLLDRLAHPEKLLTPDQVLLSVARFNQGLMIGSAMVKVPVHEGYAGGEVLMSLVHPLVPRLLWPAKPQTGGYENIHRFTSLPQSENTSINLSPLGEGYVNFGYGGILFSLFYGLLLGGIFQYVLQLADAIPSVILWLPMVYIGCLTMETDLLSTWGSLLNNALFITLLFWLLKRIRIQL